MRTSSLNLNIGVLPVPVAISIDVGTEATTLGDAALELSMQLQSKVIQNPLCSTASESLPQVPELRTGFHDVQQEAVDDLYTEMLPKIGECHSVDTWARDERSWLPKHLQSIASDRRKSIADAYNRNGNKTAKLHQAKARAKVLHAACLTSSRGLVVAGKFSSDTVESRRFLIPFAHFIKHDDERGAQNMIRLSKNQDFFEVVRADDAPPLEPGDEIFLRYGTCHAGHNELRLSIVG